ncbi:MAG TPA: LytR C-terminal domain-containing protein [Blastococcus sp.]|nr:LytR C-terminal domain-containing protein [Blastococcus sp.]
MTLRTDRPPVRARSGRRPLPPLIFLLVLALAAVVVWWNVLHQDGVRQAHNAAACASAKAAPPSMSPKELSVRVFNATDRAGEANRVAQALKDRGFTVAEVANDSSGRKVTGVGEVRHGPRGKDAAAYLGAYLPGVGDYEDTRATAQVDLVIGPDYQKLATPEQVAAAISAVPAVPGGC